MKVSTKFFINDVFNIRKDWITINGKTIIGFELDKRNDMSTWKDGVKQFSVQYYSWGKYLFDFESNDRKECIQKAKEYIEANRDKFKYYIEAKQVELWEQQQQ